MELLLIITTGLIFPFATHYGRKLAEEIGIEKDTARNAVLALVSFFIALTLFIVRYALGEHNWDMLIVEVTAIYGIGNAFYLFLLKNKL